MKPGTIVAERHVQVDVAGAGSAVVHDFAALAFQVAGTARVELRTAWTLEAGDVLVVPAGERHRRLASRDATRWSVGFCVPCLAAETSAASLLEPFERVRDGASPVVRIAPERRDFLARLFEELAATDAADRALAAVRYSLLTLITSEVSRAWVAASPAASPASGVVGEALRVIERRCLEPLTLEEVAAAVGRSPSYVTTALTRATGRSAGAWIIAGRMAEARRRLLHSDDAVERVAERVGYADVTHFIRMFRREHGATPAAWRARQRAEATRR